MTRAGRIDEAEVEGTRSEPRDLLGIEALGMSRGDAATREIVTQGAEPTSLDLVRENQTRTQERRGEDRLSPRCRAEIEDPGLAGQGIACRQHRRAGQHRGKIERVDLALFVGLAQSDFYARRDHLDERRQPIGKGLARQGFDLAGARWHHPDDRVPPRSGREEGVQERRLLFPRIGKECRRRFFHQIGRFRHSRVSVLDFEPYSPIRKPLIHRP